MLNNNNKHYMYFIHIRSSSFKPILQGNVRCLEDEYELDEINNF